MTKLEFLNKMKTQLYACYDIEEQKQLGPSYYDLFAKSHIKNEKYFGSKSINLYRFENHEYYLIKSIDKIDDAFLTLFSKNLIAASLGLVTPHQEHMSTIVHGIIVIDTDLEIDYTDVIKNFRYKKSFAFGFKGYLDVYLSVVNTSNQTILRHRLQKQLDQFVATA